MIISSILPLGSTKSLYYQERGIQRRRKLHSLVELGAAFVYNSQGYVFPGTTFNIQGKRRWIFKSPKEDGFSDPLLDKTQKKTVVQLSFLTQKLD